MDKTAIITYGILLDPEELSREYESVDYVPIKLDGYRRHFGQKSTHRVGPSGERGVLTVEEDPNSWISALLLTGLTQDEFESYKERESGYSIQRIDPDRISFYDTDWDLDRFSSILVGLGDMPLENPDPVPQYVEFCTSGAFKHGNEFGRDFVLTTERV